MAEIARRRRRAFSTHRACGTGALTSRSFRMQPIARPETFDEFEFEPTHQIMLENEIHAMVCRLAAALDEVIDSNGDSRSVVAEALMRLAMGVHLYAAGPAATRDRALAMALRTHPPDRTH